VGFLDKFSPTPALFPRRRVAVGGQLMPVARTVGHHDQDIHIAVLFGRAAGMGAEQVDLQRLERLNQPPDDLVQHARRNLFHGRII